MVNYSKEITMLTALRENMGWSKNELAERCGMAASTVTMVETRGYRPSKSVLEKFAEALDYPTTQCDRLIETQTLTAKWE